MNCFSKYSFWDPDLVLEKLGGKNHLESWKNKKKGCGKRLCSSGWGISQKFTPLPWRLPLRSTNKGRVFGFGDSIALAGGTSQKCILSVDITNDTRDPYNARVPLDTQAKKTIRLGMWRHRKHAFLPYRSITTNPILRSIKI